MSPPTLYTNSTFRERLVLSERSTADLPDITVRVQTVGGIVMVEETWPENPRRHRAL